MNYFSKMFEYCFDRKNINKNCFLCICVNTLNYSIFVQHVYLSPFETKTGKMINKNVFLFSPVKKEKKEKHGRFGNHKGRRTRYSASER